MPLAHSKLTTQGQISVPAEVRRKLGVGPGSVLEWHDDGTNIVVRRAGKYSSLDIHTALFPKAAPRRRSIHEIDEGLKAYVRKRHARD
jgi:antitoxin PrlF